MTGSMILKRYALKLCNYKRSRSNKSKKFLPYFNPVSLTLALSDIKWFGFFPSFFHIRLVDVHVPFLSHPFHVAMLSSINFRKLVALYI